MDESLRTRPLALLRENRRSSALCAKAYRRKCEPREQPEQGLGFRHRRDRRRAGEQRRVVRVESVQYSAQHGNLTIAIGERVESQCGEHELARLERCCEI